MSAEVIRVGLIGAGGNTRSRHIPGFREQAGVELVTVSNRTTGSAARVAAEFDIANVAEDWMAVLEDASVDAVCIGTWPYMHAAMTIAALEHGKHVLCEARMARDSVEARAILAASRRHPRLVAQLVPAPHTLAFDATIAQMIGAGEIGELIALDARITAGGGFPDPDSTLHWRHDRELSGNNTMSMGIWYEAMMRWVGPAASVHAVGRAVVAHRRDATGRRVAMTIPDHVDVIGRLAAGGQMRFNVSTVLGHAPAAAEVWIFGSMGTLLLSQAKGEAMVLAAGERGEEGLRPVRVAEENRGAWRVEEEFVNAVRGLEAVSHTDFATGVAYMEFTDAVAHSLQSGESVHLPLSATA